MCETVCLSHSAQTHNIKATLGLEKFYLKQSKLALIKGKTPDSKKKKKSYWTLRKVMWTPCIVPISKPESLRGRNISLLPPLAETRLQLSTVSISMHDANFLNKEEFLEPFLPSLALYGVSVMLLPLQFSSSGLAKHRRRSAALGTSQQRCKLLRPPWAFQSRHTSPSLRHSLSLCMELFTQISAEE